MKTIETCPCGGAMVYSVWDDPSSALVCAFSFDGGCKAAAGAAVPPPSGPFRASSAQESRRVTKSKVTPASPCPKCKASDAEPVADHGGTAEFQCSCGARFTNFTSRAVAIAADTGKKVSDAARELDREMAKSRRLAVAEIRGRR